MAKPAPKNAAPEPTQVYTVISPLEHDLVLYAIGEEVELTAAQAAPLLGVAVALKDAATTAG